MRLSGLLLLLLLMSACKSAEVKDPMSNCPAAIIEKPVRMYVPIPAELRKRCRWERDVLPSQSLAAARRRGECLEHYERNLDGIDQVQGKPVPW